MTPTKALLYKLRHKIFTKLFRRYYLAVFGVWNQNFFKKRSNKIGRNIHTYLSRFGNMVMSAVGFTLLLQRYSTDCTTAWLFQLFNHYVQSEQLPSSSSPHPSLSLIREENVPGLVPITPRRSQKHGHACISRDGTNVTARVGTFLLVSLIQHLAFAKAVLCCLQSTAGMASHWHLCLVWDRVKRRHRPVVISFVCFNTMRTGDADLRF